MDERLHSNEQNFHSLLDPFLCGLVKLTFDCGWQSRGCLPASCEFNLLKEATATGERIEGYAAKYLDYCLFSACCCGSYHILDAFHRTVRRYLAWTLVSRTCLNHPLVLYSNRPAGHYQLSNVSLQLSLLFLLSLTRNRSFEN